MQGIDSALKFFPLINTLIIVCGTIVALLRLQDVLASFKEELKSIHKDIDDLGVADEKLDHRLTIVETKCEMRHEHD